MYGYTIWALPSSPSARCSFTWCMAQAISAALQIILFRLVQAVGASFLFSNSVAILTDAFPPEERGMAMGINQIPCLHLGQFIGLVVGGFLAAYQLACGSSSSASRLGGRRHLGIPDVTRNRPDPRHQKLDIPGNVLFALGTDGHPGRHDLRASALWHFQHGVEQPVRAGLPDRRRGHLVVFVLVERWTEDPMFRLELFKIRMFAAGNAQGSWRRSPAAGWSSSSSSGCKASGCRCTASTSRTPRSGRASTCCPSPPASC